MSLGPPHHWVCRLYMLLCWEQELNSSTLYGTNPDCCCWHHVCFSFTSIMSPAHSSTYLNTYTGLLSLSIPPFMQSGRQRAVQPGSALSQSRWVVQTNHHGSPMLQPAGQRPRSLVLSCHTHSCSISSFFPTFYTPICVLTLYFPMSALFILLTTSWSLLLLVVSSFFVRPYISCHLFPSFVLVNKSIAFFFDGHIGASVQAELAEMFAPFISQRTHWMSGFFFFFPAVTHRLRHGYKTHKPWVVFSIGHSLVEWRLAAFFFFWTGYMLEYSAGQLGHFNNGDIVQLNESFCRMSD